MATTTNYSWVTPDNTDLVKDGAEAIRTLGSSVDSTVYSLDQDNVKITEFVAKGDLLGASAENTPARLGVGANGTILTADSAETTGLKWVAPAAGLTLIGCQLTKSATQSLSNETETAITFNGETWDTDGFHDNSVNNSRITIPTGKGGKYTLTSEVAIASGTGGGYVLIKKNGSVWEYPVTFNAVGNSLNTDFTFSILMDLVATDYVELFLYVTGGTRNALTATKLGINYIGA